MLIILTLTEKIETNFKVAKLKVNHWVRSIKYKNFFGKGYPEKWSREIFYWFCFEN